MGQAGSVAFQEKELDVFRGSDQSILNCEVGPDGKVLATCSADSTIYLWRLPTDTEPGELLQSLKGHKQEVTSCAFSGPILASASQNGGYFVAPQDRKKSFTYRLSLLSAVHSGPVYDCVFSNDGGALATSSKDTTIRRFKIKPGAGEFVPGTDTLTLSGKDGHKSTVSALAFTPDDAFIISGCEDGVIKKWSRTEGQCTETQDSRYGPVRSIRFPIRFSPADREEVFASLSGSNIVVWNMRDSMEIRKVLDTQGRHMQAICFVPGSSYLVGVSSDNCLSVWDPLSQNPRPISV
ncbi:hypothetical protein QZH41_020798, partial [Actinostola sp. cb2023]